MKAVTVSFIFLFSILSFFKDEKSYVNRIPAQENLENLDYSSLGWYKTFEDEFETASTAISKGADPTCFTKKAKCLDRLGWNTQDCAPEYQNQLKDMNKCNWRVYNYYNYMDFDAPEGGGINSFHPSKVKIENGKMILSADRSPIPKDRLDCKRKYFDAGQGFDVYSTDCPIYSGGVESNIWDEWTGKKFGFSQAYGRFEVYGKLSKGQGSWPAFWLLPEKGERDDLPEGSKGKCGWPHSGEFDILEAWSDEPDHVKSGYIAGYCNDNADVRKGFPRDVDRATSEFHLYGVEWTPNYIRFIQDDEIVGYVFKDEKVKSEDRDTKKYGPKRKAWIPFYPFYWILNLSIERGLGKGAEKVNIDTFYHQELIIESVRTYRACTPEDMKGDCQKFKMKDKGGVDGYQSTRGETAFAEINSYPNPPQKNNDNGAVTTRLKLMQYCEDVKIDLINMLGQQMAIHSEEGGNLQYLYNGPLDEGMDLYKKMYTFHLSAGVYIIRAEFRKCAPSGKGEGNQVFKLLVL